MTRFIDGPLLSGADFRSAIVTLRAIRDAGVAPFSLPEKEGYGYLFPLQRDPENLLPEKPETARNLISLGQSMVDTQPLDRAFDSDIPSAYTYFGQLIDHDITRQQPIGPPVLDRNTVPAPLSEIQGMANSRTSSLDLDCIYGPAIEPGAHYTVPRVGDKMLIEKAVKGPVDSDLPREPDSPHSPLIGDRRNDENLVISQLHVAFLRAHNTLVTEHGLSFDEAAKQLRRHYQWIVVNDYLPKIVGRDVVESVLSRKINLFDPPDDAKRMPLEFSVAAFRTAHSMSREVYNFSDSFDRAFLFQLFPQKMLAKYHHIIPGWVIDWQRFVDGTNLARKIGPVLAESLSGLDDGQGHTLPHGLGTMDLLKGYLLRLPTGQALARRMEHTPLSEQDIEAAATDQQIPILRAAGFLEKTPLWFYLLCEAKASNSGRLGAVGSEIVASVLIGLVRKSKDSFLRFDNWKPSLGKGETFELPDLLRLAGFLQNTN